MLGDVVVLLCSKLCQFNIHSPTHGSTHFQTAPSRGIVGGPNTGSQKLSCLVEREGNHFITMSLYTHTHTHTHTHTRTYKPQIFHPHTKKNTKAKKGPLSQQDPQSTHTCRAQHVKYTSNPDQHTTNRWQTTCRFCTSSLCGHA